MQVQFFEWRIEFLYWRPGDIASDPVMLMLRHCDYWKLEQVFFFFFFNIMLAQNPLYKIIVKWVPEQYIEYVMDF